MNKVNISIIITCFNREKFIYRAIRSALSQSYDDLSYEVIVVDDCSTDNSLKIINTFKDKIKIIKHEKNLGLPSARNSGILSAKGMYIVHLDSDDYLHKDILYIESLFLDLNKDIGAVSCDYYEVSFDEKIRTRKCGLKNQIACGIMFRKSHLIELGLYNEDMLMCEDEELRIRFEKRYQIHNIRLPLYRYTKHSENMTNNKEEYNSYKEKLNKLK